MLKGFRPLESNMLGDTAPLLFPVLLVLLVGWLLPSKIESYSEKFSQPVSKAIVKTHRFGPLVVVVIMLLNRIKTIVQRDTSYLEIAKILGPGDFEFSDLRLLITGEGASESILFLLLCFALLSHKLPSISNSSLEIRKLVQNRIMSYISFSALVSFWILFPESSYYSPNSLPLQITNSSLGEYSWILVILTGAMILVSSELFAVTTIPLTDNGLDILSRRTKLKMYAILPLMIYLLINSVQSTNSWWLNISQDGSFVMVIFFLSNAIGLTFITVPCKMIEVNLQHGEGRSNSLTFQMVLNCILLFGITAYFLRSSEPFSQGNGYILQASWLVIGMVIIMVISLVLPNFGFDGAARPELWWLRISLIFAPNIMFMITPFAVFLLPASWILLAISLIQPWYIEKDITSPSLISTLFPLIAIISVILVFSFSTEWPLMSFLTVGWLLGLFSSKRIEFHIKQMKSLGIA
tara:strand:+ start:13086 stop:14483 length:1398 start_codon:yes stop_codon:yes gene_type:complete